MRLICELCEERHLAAIINIHDVALAQMFVQRIVGLRQGVIVYDGAPDGLTPARLTDIYGEEDWSATRPRGAQRKPAPAHRAADEERLAGLTG
jgi:phosphonate transport system ATP-binding protein